ncbi:MAG: ABC transporter permease [Geminicoccaceae bacterium]|nr:MAG: ABC transporter permease [Geminicoccaceae bacterium]
MLGFLLQRLISLGIVLFGASLVIFAIMRFLPGDPVLAMLGFDTDPVVVAELRAELGLDRPVLVQYAGWLADAVRGDLGTSIFLRREVVDLLAARFPTTLALAIASLVVALAVAVPAGVLSARYKGKALDHVSRLVGLAGVSMPNFWLGLLLIMFFGVQLRWLPVGGYVPITQDPLAGLAHLILPAITLGTAYAATIMRMLRGSMLDVLRRDYVAVARAYGVPERTVTWHDAFKNAMIPTLTVSGFAFGYMLAGTIIVEVIFNIPGVGRLLYESILTRDYPLVQGIVLFNVALFVLVNLLVDVLYATIDPRIKV